MGQVSLFAVMETAAAVTQKGRFGEGDNSPIIISLFFFFFLVFVDRKCKNSSENEVLI